MHAVVKHKLYCSECQNIYCSTCKDKHSEAACQLTPKGSITEEQLLAAVSSESQKIVPGLLILSWPKHLQQCIQ